jgi:pyruvate dehydrogenase E2 component (dihydrolipoamide acetyltransferase)
MPSEITMPQLSDTMAEGTVVKWRKQEGDRVKAGDVVAEIETDKATMEMEAFEAGTLAHIAVPEGGKVAVGATIALLAIGKENPADVKKQFGSAKSAPSAMTSPDSVKTSAAEASSSPVSAPQYALATLEDAARGEVHEPDEVGHHATRSVVPPDETASPSPNGKGGRVRISPLAKRIAMDKGFDISKITGTGPQGRVIQRDVLNFVAPVAVAKPAPSQPASAPQVAPRPAAGAKTVIPLTKMRAVIAQRLQQSKQTLPHFYETVDIDVEAVSQLRVRINQQLEAEKIRLSIGDFVAKAVAVTLQRHPALNATFDGKEITRHASVNLGMAVALPEGLIVPVLRGIEQLGLRDIRLRSADLVERARAQRLKQDELSGATFSVSNLGTFGVREFSAIINPPEVGILAVAAAEKRAVVRNDQIVARTMLTVTLSADHRVVDGAAAAEFLRTLKSLLEEPGLMLA